MLELATIGGARALRMEDQIGSLEPGKRADIIAVDLSSSHQSPLVDPVSAVVTGSSTSDVIFTMINGVVRFTQDEGWNVGANPQEAMRRGATIRGKLRD